MLEKSYAARRRGENGMNRTAAWTGSHNTVRRSARQLGPVSSVVIVALLLLTMGLIYVAQGARTSGYDYELSAVESEIAELSARKEDLAAEQARATSIASIKNSEVAANMEAAHVSGYAN